ILRPGSFANGIVVQMALGGSTNAAIHVIAMAARAGIAVTLDQMDAEARRTPVLANLHPSGRFLMEDFFRAGGLRALLARVAGRLDGAMLTVNGRTLGDNIADARCWNDDVIRPLDNPVTAAGTLAVLRGNLAPDGAVIKPSAAS